MSAEVELRKNCPNHEQVKVPCSSFKWTLWTDIDCDLHCLLSPQRMNRCQRSEGQRGRPFAVTWSPPGLGWDRQTDRQTDWQTNGLIISYVRACLLHSALPPDRWTPLLVSLPCLKASSGVERPCMQKILWRRRRIRRDGEKGKDDDMKRLALWKKRLQKPELVPGRQTHKTTLDVAVRNKTKPQNSPVNTTASWRVELHLHFLIFYFLNKKTTNKNKDYRLKTQRNSSWLDS